VLGQSETTSSSGGTVERDGGGDDMSIFEDVGGLGPIRNYLKYSLR
jgi:hypothetical protein